MTYDLNCGTLLYKGLWIYHHILIACKHHPLKDLAAFKNWLRGGGGPGLDIPGLYAQVTSGGQGTHPTNGQVVIVDNFTHGGR